VTIALLDDAYLGDHALAARVLAAGEALSLSWREWAEQRAA
jgi:hypothetical protein